jgi:hypothetical protein
MDHLETLRAGISAGPLDNTVHFAPGIKLFADPSDALIGTWTSPAQRLLEIRTDEDFSGDWLGLHIALDLAPLRDVTFLGFACRTAAATETLVRVCIRSGLEDGFSDQFFSRHILSLPEPLTHTDALYVPATPGLPDAAPWRELVLFLPREQLDWHLHDLRIFAL